MPMFYSITGCDTVSSFAGRGKRTAWDIWNLYPEVTETFHALMEQPSISQVDDAMGTIERFMVLIYDTTSTKSYVDGATLELFVCKGRDVSNIPPTKGALLQHVRRAVYQAGLCWSQSLSTEMNLP